MTLKLSARIFAGTVCAALFVGGAGAAEGEGVRLKFRDVDKDGDGSLQFSEIGTARGTIFDRMDANANGILDVEELDSISKIAQSRKSSSWQSQIVGADDLAARSQLIDADHDGKISRAEFAAYLPERLKNADSDGNQALVRSELRSLKQGGETSTTEASQ